MRAASLKKRKREVIGIISMLIMLIVLIVLADDRLSKEFDSFAMMITLISVIGMIMLIVLYAIRFIGSRDIDEFDYRFDMVIFFAYISYFIEARCKLLTGLNDQTFLLTVYLALSYIIGILVLYSAWAYQEQYLERGKMAQAGRIIVVSATVAYILNAIISIWDGHLFYVDADGIPQYLQSGMLLALIIVSLIFIVIIYNIAVGVNNTRIKAMLISSLAFPMGAFVIMLMLGNLLDKADISVTLVNYGFTIGLYVLFFYLHVDEKERGYKQQIENQSLRSSIIASQIGPHFLFNALATIEAISEEEHATESAKAIHRFATYLRMNLDSIGATKMVKFTEELEHIKTYLWIETLRFGDDLKVVYDIDYDYFFVPPLLIQPIVENAVVHGVLKKEEGGTVTISTRLDGDEVVVNVEDDGVGFDVYETKTTEGRSHLGMENVRARLENILGGTMTVESKKGLGTKVTLRIPVMGG